MVDEKFGKRLKELRKAKNISLRKMAGMLGITPAYLSRIENGHEHPPSAKYIKLIAGILGIDENQLFELLQGEIHSRRLPGEIIDGYQRNKVTRKKVPEFFRTVKEANLSEAEWNEIIENVKNKRKSLK